MDPPAGPLFVESRIRADRPGWTWLAALLIVPAGTLAAWFGFYQWMLRLKGPPPGFPWLALGALVGAPVAMLVVAIGLVRGRLWAWWVSILVVHLAVIGPVVRTMLLVRGGMSPWQLAAARPIDTWPILPAVIAFVILASGPVRCWMFRAHRLRREERLWADDWQVRADALHPPAGRPEGPSPH